MTKPDSSGPSHGQPAYAEWGYGVGAFPIAEAIHREVLSLPMGKQRPVRIIETPVFEYA